MIYPTEKHFINIHSHKKAINNEEWVLRNAFLKLDTQQLSKLNYAVSVGLHPWFAHQFSERTASLLKDNLAMPNVVAVGEIGLDRVHGSDINLQKKVFEKQLAVALEFKKPVIIHCVKAYSDVAAFVKQSKVNFIFHQFNGNTEQLNQLLMFKNTWFSFGKDLMMNNPKIIEVFKNTPNDRFFLETDTSSFRIQEIYHQSASIRQIDLALLKKQVFNNFKAVFEKDTNI